MIRLVSHIQDKEDALLKLWDEISCFFECEEISETVFLGEDLSGEDVFAAAGGILGYDEVYHRVSRHKDAALLTEQDISEAAGRFYDEFLKMAYARSCEDTYYLFWDADTIPCRYFSPFGKNNIPLLDIRTELYEDTGKIMGQLVPGLDKMIQKSFLSGHMLISTKIMRELLDEIEADTALEGESFWEKILAGVKEGYLTDKSFSAYELYGSYVMDRYPYTCLLREWSTFRQGGDLLEKDKLSLNDIEWLGMDFDSVCFERGHFVREDNIGIFDNPEYRKKLRPAQMLQAVQGEYAEEKPREKIIEAEAAIRFYKDNKDTDEYHVYEEVGDRLKKTNTGQAWLSYQHARFLCGDDTIKMRLSDKMDALGVTVPPAAIVIVSYRSRKLMRECLESIRRTCGKDEYSIIVVDNASTDGVREYLEKQPDVTLICNEDNEGFPKACNQGIEAARPGEDIFFLNNDTRLTHNALFWLRMGLYESDDTGAAGCVGNYAGIGQMLELLLATPENYTAYARLKNRPMQEPYADAKILCGFAMLVRRNVIDEYGGMDEAFTPGYYEDTDLSLRIRSKGYRLRICNNSFIYHAGGQNFKKRPDLEEITDRNLLHLAQRWGVDFMDR